MSSKVFVAFSFGKAKRLKTCSFPLEISNKNFGQNLVFGSLQSLAYPTKRTKVPAHCSLLVRTIAVRKLNGLNLQYKISISGSTTEEDQSDNSPEYKTQESTVTIQTVTSQQPEREPVDMRNFKATLDVHGDKTSHTFSKV